MSGREIKSYLDVTGYKATIDVCLGLQVPSLRILARMISQTELKSY